MFAHWYNYALFGTSIDEVMRLCERNRHGNINRLPDNLRRRAELARVMRKRGYSYPEIADALGYRSHSAVIALLRRDERATATHGTEGE